LRYLGSQFLRKPIQLLQRIQSRNRTPILNPITEEGRQNLDLLSGQELGRQRLNDGGEEGDGLSAQYGIFIIDVFAKLLNNSYQGSRLAFDICIESSIRVTRGGECGGVWADDRTDLGRRLRRCV
jgi:hypothetical protein